MSQKQIARTTGLPLGTVKHYLSTGYASLKLNSQSDLIAFVAKRSGIDLRVLFDRLRASHKGSD